MNFLHIFLISVKFSTREKNPIANLTKAEEKNNLLTRILFFVWSKMISSYKAGLLQEVRKNIYIILTSFDLNQ